MITFAYGSNLDLEDPSPEMRRAAPTLRPLRRAWLPDHRLAFHYFSKNRGGGTLDVVPALGSAVPGMLFAVGDPRPLDEKEGHPDWYRRTEVAVLDEHNEPVACVTYRLTPGRVGPFVPPAPSYLALVHNGYSAFGLDDTRMLDGAERDEHHPGVDGVFVYGSLKEGHGNAWLLARPRVPATIAGALVDLGPFPGLVRGDGTVTGEYAPIDDLPEILPGLDRLERFEGFGGGDNLYDRILVRVQTAGGPRRAWTYRYTGLMGPGIALPGGVWPVAGRPLSR